METIYDTAMDIAEGAVINVIKCLEKCAKTLFFFDDNSLKGNCKETIAL